MGERTRGEGCRVMLRHCLAIIVRKEGCQGDPGDFWMYESGYLLFQVIKQTLNGNTLPVWDFLLRFFFEDIYIGSVGAGEG